MLTSVILVSWTAAHIQESCVKEASWAGAKAALAATAISGAVIFGGCHFFPRFAKALSTSARTALIVRMPKGGGGPRVQLAERSERVFLNHRAPDSYILCQCRFPLDLPCSFWRLS